MTPVAALLGIDPIQFGLIFVLNLMLGTITPPVGVVLFITAKTADISFDAMSRAIIPWFILLIVVLISVSIWPPLATWLPSLFLGR